MKWMLCHCGAMRKRGERCSKCRPAKADNKTTAERGYDWQWRQLSERIRKDRPLCEHCLAKGKVWPATECHHKIKIKDAPHLRLDPDNIMSVCSACHKELEESERCQEP
jgi:5-methylcytosine-specific restriction protein A